MHSNRCSGGAFVSIGNKIDNSIHGINIFIVLMLSVSKIMFVRLFVLSFVCLLVRSFIYVPKYVSPSGDMGIFESLVFGTMAFWKNGISGKGDVRKRGCQEK